MQIGFADDGGNQGLTSPEDPSRGWIFPENPGMDSRGAPGHLPIQQQNTRGFQNLWANPGIIWDSSRAAPDISRVPVKHWR